MAVEGPGREQLRTLAARLKEATEGQGLRRELMRQLDKAVQPLAREIASPANLQSHMPHRYAAVLAADLDVRVQKLFGTSARISIVAKARAHRRKLAVLEDGRINHPVFAEGPRRGWEWENDQTRGMRPRFFAGPCERAVPGIRDHVAQAMAETARKITDGR
jgi:hypothetical protein